MATTTIDDDPNNNFNCANKVLGNSYRYWIGKWTHKTHDCHRCCKARHFNCCPTRCTVHNTWSWSCWVHLCFVLLINAVRFQVILVLRPFDWGSSVLCTVAAKALSNCTLQYVPEYFDYIDAFAVVHIAAVLETYWPLHPLRCLI